MLTFQFRMSGLVFFCSHHRLVSSLPRMDIWIRLSYFPGLLFSCHLVSLIFIFFPSLLAQDSSFCSCISFSPAVFAPLIMMCLISFNVLYHISIATFAFYLPDGSLLQTLHRGSLHPAGYTVTVVNFVLESRSNPLITNHSPGRQFCSIFSPDLTVRYALFLYTSRFCVVVDLRCSHF